jgi:hypothetical protein
LEIARDRGFDEIASLLDAGGAITIPG